MGVNRDLLSTFRCAHPEALDALMTETIGTLLHQNLVSLNRVAQEGMRVRASAGKSSFRREGTLHKHLKQARQQVEQLRQQSSDGDEADGDEADGDEADGDEADGDEVDGHATPRQSADTDESFAVRQRMQTDEAEAIYRQRSAKAEFPNAGCRNRGLNQFRVRGRLKARTLALWQALAHNFPMIRHHG